MPIELSAIEIDTILGSLEYSKDWIRNAKGTLYDVRQENLSRIDAVCQKLRDARIK